MQIKNAFLTILTLITILNHSVKGMEEHRIVAFQKDQIMPGCIQDLNTLLKLEKMARTAFNNLKESDNSVSDEPFQTLKLAQNNKLSKTQLLSLKKLWWDLWAW